MKPAAPEVLYEDNHLLVLNKPPLMATMGAESGEPTAVVWGKDYLKRKYAKPGNVYLGVVSRLDSFVTGVLPLARTSKAAGRLTKAFAERQVEKQYLALVPKGLRPDSGEWIDWVLKNDARRRMECVEPKTPGAQRAVLRYKTLGSDRELKLVSIQLETGRKHQIRVQFASRGFPILGDRKYGGTPMSAPGIFLHCHRLMFPHPTQDRTVEVVAPLPPPWASQFRGLGERID